jgi:hypothetical protein
MVLFSLLQVIAARGEHHDLMPAADERAGHVISVRAEPAEDARRKFPAEERDVHARYTSARYLKLLAAPSGRAISHTARSGRTTAIGHHT